MLFGSWGWVVVWRTDPLRRGPGEGRNIDLYISYIKKIKIGNFTGACIVYLQELPESTGEKWQGAVGFTTSREAKAYSVVHTPKS